MNLTHATARRAALAVVATTISAATVAGCSHGGHGGDGSGGAGGGGTSVVTTFSPTAATPAVRPDTRTGASAPAVSLQDQKLHQYTFPAVPGATFNLSLDTTPSAQPLQILIVEVIANGTATPTTKTIIQEAGTTPYTKTVTASADSTINVFVFDDRQNNLTLSNLSVLSLQQQPNATSLTAFVHIAGDAFIGFSSIAENAQYNDLATTSDQQRFVTDLLNGVNAIWASTGVQINVGASGFRRLSSAQVQSVDPTLVQGGLTVLDAGDLDLNVPARRWGNLGIDASDPAFGTAVDIFLVQQGVPNSAGEVAGFNSGIKLRSQGGIFEGKGLNHSLTFALASSGGTVRGVGFLTKTLAHELGHFLSLLHTTETNFTPDDLSDTPSSSKAYDTNGNGALDLADTATFPDGTNLMFPFLLNGMNQRTLTLEQGAALRAYLALRKH